MSGWLTRNRGPGLRCECILDYGMPGVQAEEFGTDLIKLFVCWFFFFLENCTGFFQKLH